MGGSNALEADRQKGSVRSAFQARLKDLQSHFVDALLTVCVKTDDILAAKLALHE
jgi:hypothetical protein